MALRLLSRSIPVVIRTPSRPAINQTRSLSTPKKSLPSFSMEGKVSNSLEAFPVTNGPDQVCMVTGAARGLGNEFCRAFIQSCVNWHIACMDI
jgi:hypothetical protein